MIWVGLDELVVAGVWVGRGDHGEVQEGGWGVGVSLLTTRVFMGILDSKNEMT